MSVITGRRLNRFWQKGIKPLKDLLGSHDIEDLSDDGTVTGALSKLNTEMQENDTSLRQQRAFRYNDSGALRNLYIDFEFREGDKGAVIVITTVSETVNCIRRYDLIRGNAIHYSTIQQGSGGIGYNGHVLLNSAGSQTTGNDAVTLVLLNVEGYAEVEMYAGNIALKRSYFVNA